MDRQQQIKTLEQIIYTGHCSITPPMFGWIIENGLMTVDGFDTEKAKVMLESITGRTGMTTIKFSEVLVGEMFHAREGGLYRKRTDETDVFFNTVNVRTCYCANFEQSDLVIVVHQENVTP